MTRTGRVTSFLIGLIVLVYGALLILDPRGGLRVAIGTLSLGLTLRGLRSLYYYLTMARFMVGGKAVLWRGILYLEAGLFAGAMSRHRSIILFFYVVGIHLFIGAADILRAIDAKRLMAPQWKTYLALGITNLLVVIAVTIGGIVFRATAPMMYAYGAGLVYSGVVRMVAAFRRSAIAYIP